MSLAFDVEGLRLPLATTNADRTGRRTGCDGGYEKWPAPRGTGLVPPVGGLGPGQMGSGASVSAPVLSCQVRDSYAFFFDWPLFTLAQA
jgi:hypothetical protein